jgi:hypothetical protein
MADYEALDDKEKKNADKPVQKRLYIEDVTPEKVQMIMEENTEGLLLVRDELSGWFGGMDKYSGSRGGSYDRGFWLKAHKGGLYSFDRVSRGSRAVENCGVSVLGGIQDDKMRKIINEGDDDGLIQRLLLIMLHPAVKGKRVSVPCDYDELIGKLRMLAAPLGPAFEEANKRYFDPEAEAIREEVEQLYIDKQDTFMGDQQKTCDPCRQVRRLIRTFVFDLALYRELYWE